ncbi:MAG: hypothetical protein V8R75_06470 [Oscillospiraceae bacterium]
MPFKTWERLRQLLRWLLGILSPFLLGGALAFVLNVRMRAIERHLYPYSRRGQNSAVPWPWC